MGFILKLIFIYFLIKLLWSFAKRPILNKAQRKMSEKIKQAMDEQMRNSGKNTNDRYKFKNNDEGSKDSKSKNVIEAEYKVLKK